MWKIPQTTGERVRLLREAAAGRASCQVTQQLAVRNRVKRLVEAGRDEGLRLGVGNHSSTLASLRAASAVSYASANALRARKRRSFAAFSVMPRASAVSASDSP